MYTIEHVLLQFPQMCNLSEAPTLVKPVLYQMKYRLQAIMSFTFK